MKLDTFKKEITKRLNHELDQYSDPRFTKALKYAVLPTGKLIRPALVWAWCQDHNQQITDNHFKLALSLELHHSYTLVHDDLPAMDDDDMRRGKPSLHKEFSQAKAILVGDALLALSFKVLADIDSPYLKELTHFYHRAIGPRGLILGQDLDLSTQKKSFGDILEVFELKTARLFQIALVGSSLLAGTKEYQEELELGKTLGIFFQLKDDFGDFQEQSKPEELNIFKVDENKATEILSEYKDKTTQALASSSYLKELF